MLGLPTHSTLGGEKRPKSLNQLMLVQHADLGQILSANYRETANGERGRNDRNERNDRLLWLKRTGVATFQACFWAF